ncbi:MAG: signal peptidase I [SAR202 cluster bacterium]|nr:signal peptidase I [SAR202 cluster bacterium]
MRRFLRDLIETVLMALVIYLALQFSVQPYKVEGSSMHPTLQQGEYVLVNKLVYWHFSEDFLIRVAPFLSEDDDSNIWPAHPPRRGEIVIFKFPLDTSRNFVKRVIGVPGDVIEITNGVVFVNGVRLDEPYLMSHSEVCTGRYGCRGPYEVPADTYYVLGDNRGASDDSRNWGPVPVEDIIGREWVSYWPLDNLRSTLGF